MDSNGIMSEIRSHLSSGKSSGEVIGLGFKPPTVYKVQRALKRKSQADGVVSTPGSAQPPATSADNQLLSQLEAENIRLRQEVEAVEGELECVVDSDAELAAQVQTLRERVKALAGCGKTLSTIPLAPFLARKGEEFISEGHPQTPCKGASPLCTPHFSAAC